MQQVPSIKCSWILVSRHDTAAPHLKTLDACTFPSCVLDVLFVCPKRLSRYSLSYGSVEDGQPVDIQEPFLQSVYAPTGATNLIQPGFENCQLGPTAMAAVTSAQQEKWPPATNQTLALSVFSPQANRKHLQSERGLDGDSVILDETSGVEGPPVVDCTTSGSREAMRGQFRSNGRRGEHTKFGLAESSINAEGSCSSTIVEMAAPNYAHLSWAQLDLLPANSRLSSNGGLRATTSGALPISLPADTSGSYITMDDESGGLNTPVPAAIKHAVVVEDTEERGVPVRTNKLQVDGDANTTAPMCVANDATAGTATELARVAITATSQPVVVEDGVVLPCAPSDKEKVRNVFGETLGNRLLKLKSWRKARRASSALFTRQPNY